MSDELKTIKIAKEEAKKIPTGFQKVFLKAVMDENTTKKLTIESKKYNKAVMEAYRPTQPISKMFD